jgi:hypothetical protein
MARVLRVARGVFAAVAFLVCGSQASAALADPVPLGSDFEIGVPPASDRDASNAAVAYSPEANEFLVAFNADFGVDERFTIRGQRVGPSDELIGSLDAFSNNSPLNGLGDRDALTPVIAQAPFVQLVVFSADMGSTPGQFIIFFGYAGAGDGSNYSLSTSAPVLDDEARDATNPAVAYNPDQDEALVVWQEDRLANDDEFEIWGRRLAMGSSDAIGPQFRISNVGADVGADPSAARDGLNPAVAYNTDEHEYLVTWEGDGLATDDEVEIFGQRVNADGTEEGGDFQISNVGATDDPTFDAADSDVVYNPTAGEYLVTWEGESLGVDLQSEISGQRISSAGTQVGSDFPISTADATRPGASARTPTVVYNPGADEYLVAWSENSLPSAETEIFARRLTGAGGELGPAFRVSSLGSDGAAERAASRPSVALNSTTGDYLVAYEGDGFETDDVLGIFGRRVGEPPEPPTEPTNPITGSTTPPIPPATPKCRKGFKLKKVKGKKKCVKKKKRRKKRSRV